MIEYLLVLTFTLIPSLLIPLFILHGICSYIYWKHKKEIYLKIARSILYFGVLYFSTLGTLLSLHAIMECIQDPTVTIKAFAIIATLSVSYIVFNFGIIAYILISKTKTQKN